MTYDSERDRERLENYRQRHSQDQELDAGEELNLDSIEKDFRDTCWVGEHREEIAWDDWHRVSDDPTPFRVFGSAEGIQLFPGFGGEAEGDVRIRAAARAALIGLSGEDLAAAMDQPRGFLAKLEADD